MEDKNYIQDEKFPEKLFVFVGQAHYPFARWQKWFLMQVAISPTFYDQLFYTQASLYTDSLGRYFFGKRKSAKKLLLKCWWICLQGRDLTFRYTRHTNNKFTIWKIRDRLERPYLRYNSPKSSTIEHIIFCSLCGLRVMVFLSLQFPVYAIENRGFCWDISNDNSIELLSVVHVLTALWCICEEVVALWKCITMRQAHSYTVRDNFALLS